MSKILIMGLPGAGKTTLAKALRDYLTHNGVTVQWYNADKVREITNNWDFSEAGRLLQNKIMTEMANSCEADYVICDFVAPLEKAREVFSADWLIWVDTIKESRFKDTDKCFVPPSKYNFRITEQNSEFWADIIGERIITSAKYGRKKQ